MKALIKSLGPLLILIAMFGLFFTLAILDPVADDVTIMQDQ